MFHEDVGLGRLYILKLIEGAIKAQYEGLGVKDVSWTNLELRALR